MKIIETHPKEKDFVLWGHCQNILDDPRKLLNQVHRYHKIRKAFFKFYQRHPELIGKYNIDLKTLLQQGILEPVFYVELVYKYKRILVINL